MFKKISRFMQTSPYSKDNRREHSRRYHWTLDDFEKIKQMRGAALSVDQLIGQLAGILAGSGIDEFKKIPKEGLDNASCPLEALIGDDPKTVMRELDMYLGKCSGYAHSAGQAITKLSKIVEIDKKILAQVYELSNKILRITH